MLALLSAVQRWPFNNNNNRIQGTNSQQLRLYFNSLTLPSHLNTSLLALHLSKTIAARSIHLFYTHRNGANTIKPGAKHRRCSLRHSGSRLQSEPVYSAGVTVTEIKRCYRVKLNRGFRGDVGSCEEAPAEANTAPRFECRPLAYVKTLWLQSLIADVKLIKGLTKSRRLHAAQSRRVCVCARVCMRVCLKSDACAARYLCTSGKCCCIS